MKKLALILVLAFSSNLIFAQAKDDSSQLSKKEQRKAKLEEQYKAAKRMIEDKNFVLETEFLKGTHGIPYPVNSNINFVMVDSTTAVIQIGSDYRVGPNGVGGITAKGKITKWEVNEDKKRNSVNVRMNVMTPIGFYDVYLTLGPSGKATARLTGMRYGSLTFDGNMVALKESDVYEGNSL